MAEQIVWAVKRPDIAGDSIVEGAYSAIGTTRTNAWHLHHKAHSVGVKFPEVIKYWEARGYRCVRVKVSEVDHD